MEIKVLTGLLTGKLDGTIIRRQVAQAFNEEVARFLAEQDLIKQKDFCQEDVTAAGWPELK